MIQIQEFMARSFFKNTLSQYAVALGIFLGCLLLIVLLRRLVMSRLEGWAAQTTTVLDDIVVRILRWAFFPLLAVGALALSLKGLLLPGNVTRLVSLLWAAILTVFGVRAVLALLLYLLRDRWASDRSERGIALKAVEPVLQVLLWTVGLVFFLDNAGVKISAVVAGLGIGGVAVALAAQAVLGDLFSYVAILFDRPFLIGDFIIIDNFMGVVEKIGIKTTRIRSLSGELLVFPNSSLTSARIRNYKSMEKRRVVFGFGVVYETPTPVLREIPGLVRDIVGATPETLFDRAHFASYGDSSLNFEVVFYVLTGDYNRYMDAQQAINFRLKEEFEKRGISFAYPTRMVYTAPAR